MVAVIWDRKTHHFTWLYLDTKADIVLVWWILPNAEIINMSKINIIINFPMIFFQTVEEHSGSGFVTGDPGFPIKRENGKFSYFINKL